MHNCGTYLALLLFGLLPISSYCTVFQDTIPPVFTTVPRDTIVSCEANIEAAFDTWYSLLAYARADNGEASVFPTLAKAAALDSLERVVALGCANTENFNLGFFATDSCGNRSDTTHMASFIILDSGLPFVTRTPQNKEVACTPSLIDSLQLWIDEKGTARIEDNCSDTIIWTNYSWIDNAGNQGFSTFEEPTNILIDRTNCLWSVDVSFFFEDGCGNSNVTQAKFSTTEDNSLPEVGYMPPSSTLLCEALRTDTFPTIVDACDGLIIPELRETDNRSLDSLDCAYYNYEIIQTWTASDACGNTIDTSLVITIRDTIKPTITAEASIALDCDFDLNQADDLASALDNCSFTSLSFQDSILFTSTCQNQISRKWTAVDACGNLDSFVQIIQLQDFTGPEFITIPNDTLISCDASNIEAIFSSWLATNANAQIIDNCNGFSIRALDPKVYADTVEIAAAPIPVLNLSDYKNAFGALSTQQISFVAYDQCGNITQREALFTIIDPEAPIISNCPVDFDLQLSGEQCEAEYNLTLPQFTDNCLTSDAALWTVYVNDILVKEDASNNESIILDIGVNLIDYVLTDCGGNSGSCTQEIVVSDTSPPRLTCPPDQTIFVEDSSCEVLFESMNLLALEENCDGLIFFEKTAPPVNEFLTFNFNTFSDVYQASDFIITMDNLSLPEIIINPKLTIEYRIDLDQGSTITVADENGTALTNLTSSSCAQSEKEVHLQTNTLRQWASDSKLNFTIINNANNGNGTSPCDPTVIDGFQGQDGISYLRVKLTYSEGSVSRELIDVSSGLSDILVGPRILSAGAYQISYLSSDASDNEGSCITNLTIRDSIAPIINCEDIVYKVDPLLQDFYPILAPSLDYNARDNCGIDSFYFFPRQVLCSDLGTNLAYTVFVKDAFDNLSECTAQIEVIPEELNPEFLSRLCFADTLKLFSNIPDNLGFQVTWEGPNNYRSNLLNPQVIGLSEDASGLYNLTARSPQGCVFTGSINIDVKEFISPEIFTNQTTICQGEQVLLNTNSFTEIVEYFWYEGISPNGTLIGKTGGPSLAINPVLGNHFYYVEVKGDDCNSNPSNTLELSVSPPPNAAISNPFITLCEGDDLMLMTEVFDINYNYEWTGPNNYNSTGQFPEVINSVEKINQGTYTLVIKQGECTSDTVSAQVIIFENPEKPSIDGESIFCEGQTAVLTVANIPTGTRYSWYRNGNFFRSVNSNSLLIPAIASDQSGSWTVVVEEGICKSDTSASFQINVESQLNIGASNNGPHCEGDSVLLTCSFIPGATYSWEDPLGINYDGRIVSGLAVEGVYTVTVTTPSNCDAVTNTRVVVGSRPEITALSNTSLPCMSEDMPVSLVPSVFPPGNYQYAWSGPNNFKSIAPQPTITNIKESDNGIYTLIITQGNCQSFPVTTSINITTIPDQAILIANDDPCEGDEVIISIQNAISGSDLAWIWTTPNGNITTTTPELLIPIFEKSNNGNYSVVQIKNNCRAIASDELTIAIQTEPVIPSISGNKVLCAGEDLVFSVIPNDADIYTWLTPQGTITTTDNTLELNAISETEEGSYAVILQEGNCESETSVPIQVEVKAIPSSPTFIEEQLEFCLTKTQDYTLCISENDLDFDLLNLIELNTAVVLQQSTTNCFDLDFLLNSGTQELDLSVIAVLNNCSSTSTDTLKIKTYQPDSEGAEVDERTIFLCDQDFTSLTAEQIPDLIEIKWTAANPAITIFNDENKTTSLSNLEDGQNEIYLTSSLGNCNGFYTDTIDLIVLNEIRARDDIYNLPFQQSLNINPLENDEFNGAVTLSVLAEPDLGLIDIEMNTIIYTPPTGLVGTKTIEYELCYANCPTLCDRATIELTIGENVNCFVGNVFTPNGDGVNDLLMVPCLETENYPQNALIIFNQWGDEILSEAPYRNDWQGTHKGKTLPAGTYFYILDLGDGSKPIQGYITLEL